MKKFLIWFIPLISFVFCRSEPIVTYNITLPANAFTTPQISPDNKYVFISGSTETEKYLVICNLNTGEYSRLFDQNNSQRKRKGRGKRNRRMNREETIVGWIMDGGIPYLYTAIDEIKSPTETKTVFYEHGDDPKEYNRYFDSKYPNKPNATLVNSDQNHAWISFINGPYGLYKINLNKSNLPLSKHPIVKTSNKVQAITTWGNKELLLVGQENIYNFYRIVNNDAELVNIDISEYTLIRDPICHPLQDGVFSFIGSNADYQDDKLRGDLCIYDINNTKYIEKITIYFDKDSYGGNRFSQWAPTKNRLYFLKKKRDEISLYFYNYLNGKIQSAGVDENKIKSFVISNDGQYCAILRDSNTDQITVYKLDD